MKSTPLHTLLALAVSLVATFARADAPPPDYAKVQAIFNKNCLACHDAKEAEGDLVLETHATLMKGGETGPAVVSGKSGESLLVKLIEHGKKPYMPPPKKGDKLSDDDIATIRGWIDAGAAAPSGDVFDNLLKLPTVLPKNEPVAPIRSIATRREGAIALAHGEKVEWVDTKYQATTKSLDIGATMGAVNAVAFSPDGAWLAAASGIPGAYGDLTLTNVRDLRRDKILSGHADAIYAVSISPDSTLIATGSYDQKIILWDMKTATPIRTLSGHNGAVFGLSFRPDGKVLASASADRTVKLWNVATGERLDTLSDATKELHCVTFSRDGNRVAAGGVDNRVRVWAISDSAKEGTNKIVHSTFAHEGAILSLALSADGKTLLTTADDRTAKLWNFDDMTPRLALPPQPDWPAAAAFTANDKTIVIGRLDGSLGFYSAADGKKVPPARPVISSPKTFGVRRGESVKLELTGEGLQTVNSVSVDEPRATVKWLSDATPNHATAEICTPADLPPAKLELRVIGPGGTSDPVTLHVDTLPQWREAEPNEAPIAVTAVGDFPVSLWGKMDRRGDVDSFAFDAKAGRTIVFDVAAKRFGSAADVVLTLLGPDGRAVAGANDFNADVDPLLTYAIPADGRYTVCVSELSAAASDNHFYRLSIGEFAYVTGVYPLAVAPGATAPVRLLGFNLANDATVNVSAPPNGEAAVPIDANIYRSRRSLKVLAGYDNESTEREPNDAPDQATALPIPGGASGVIGAAKSDGTPDADLYRIEAKAGQTWVIETMAARLGTPTDTKIEILDAAGKPVPRVALRAVRDSSITFRPITADAGGARLVHWEEMDLNQYLYLNGEVVKLFQAPRGPDSEFGFYTLGGRRVDYFDTSAAAHALDEACYIVEPHTPAEAAKLPPNGLPTFTIPYANDDDAQHQLGADSRLTFSPPTDGSYFIRVTDTRGFGGDRYAYRLVVRPAKPDFKVVIDNLTPTIMPGAGRRFSARVDRTDGFDGPVRVEFNNPPPGFKVSSPIVIQAGLTEADGTVYAAAEAKEPSAESLGAMKGSATATIDGKEIIRPIDSFKKIAIGAKPGLTVTLAPDPKAALARSAGATARGESPADDEIVLTPGKLTPAWLRIARGAHADRVTFEVENLPHGVIVADIGLNGVLIPEGQAERQIFLQCAAWVPDSERLCYARANEADQPTSPPVKVRVRREK